MGVAGGIAAAAGAAAQAVFGSNPPTDGNAQFAVQGDLGIWEDWYVRNTYPLDNHRYQMPLTSPEGFQGATCAFVQLAAPTRLWICDWSCEYRTDPGDYPKYPRATPSIPNIVLLNTVLLPDMVTMGGDGVSAIYRISGTYYYGYKNPSKVVQYHGRPPWMSEKVPRKVVLAKQIQGIIAEKY